ncbi:hypothetical protein [Bradyrhizobium archetypum]|nr:hypothetical protein [Bradyrhizobium archetypum]
MTGITARAYAAVRVMGYSLIAAVGRANMPAYIHHDGIEPGFVICPSCVGLPMFVRDVEPNWSQAKIDFTYECADCGAEVRQTVAKPELQH